MPGILQDLGAFRLLFQQTSTCTPISKCSSVPPVPLVLALPSGKP